MKLYVNGRLAGTRTNADAAFAMPKGQGYLGCNDTGGEAMKGIIHRVTVYEGSLPDATVLRHANAFMNVARPALVVVGHDAFRRSVKHILILTDFAHHRPPRSLESRNS